MSTYKIVRFHFQGGRSEGEDREGNELPSGLTLEEAQEHCNDPETSSKTATSEDARAYTAKHGPWFDGYEEE